MQIGRLLLLIREAGHVSNCGIYLANMQWKFYKLKLEECKLPARIVRCAPMPGESRTSTRNEGSTLHTSCMAYAYCVSDARNVYGSARLQEAFYSRKSVAAIRGKDIFLFQQPIQITAMTVTGWSVSR